MIKVMNQPKKIIQMLRIGCLVILVLYFVVGCSINSADNEKEIETGPEWTFLFYDNADFTNAGDPMYFFMTETYSSENVNVLVLQDTNYGPATIWHIDENHERQAVRELGEVDMGSSQTVSDFVEFAKTNYPARRYIISFYNHGGGWTGACNDDTDNGFLYMEDIRKGLADNGGVDLVLFSAPCLMGALESVYELRDCTSVYIGSENLSGYMWWFGTMEYICDTLNRFPKIGNYTLARNIISNIQENASQSTEYYDDYFTMSAIKTDGIENAVTALNDVGAAYLNNIDTAYPIIKSLSGTYQTYYDGFCTDAYDFLSKLHAVETDPQLRTLLENAMNELSLLVLAEEHGANLPGTHGLSIFFPGPQRYNYYNGYTWDELGLDFPVNTQWDEFVGAYISKELQSSHGPKLQTGKIPENPIIIPQFGTDGLSPVPEK